MPYCELLGGTLFEYRGVVYLKLDNGCCASMISGHVTRFDDMVMVSRANAELKFRAAGDK